MTVVVGIDGGGMRTRLVAADAEGRVRAAVEAASINPDDHDEAHVAQVLRAAVAELARDAARSGFDAAFLALGGVRSEHDRRAALRMAEAAGVAPADRIGVHHDAFAALEGGLLGAPGALLVAGTGSIVFGRDGDGREATCGDWGPLFGDEGSGHWLGREALRAVAHAYDGRGGATVLTDVVRARLAIDSVDELLRRIHDADVDRAAIASLAPDVLRAVRDGDAVADGILGRGCQELARCVALIAERLFAGSQLPLVVTGGLTKDATYLAALQRRVREAAPSARFTEARLPPVLGAVRLALARAGWPASAEVDGRLVRARKSLPASF